ncbi:hypothetical protein [Nocardioides houyundeii]|uniref:hypothetical protein n=1 Tax=Nocardioides houyundeii TaxID=2045452 RepID=UPI000DF465D7|nr:hypothetical protein [Nocardioides houyundeii]
MPKDYESVSAHIDLTVRELWAQAQRDVAQESVPPADLGDAIRSVSDDEIARTAGVDLADVRQYLDGAEGRDFVLGREGETRTVKAVIPRSSMQLEDLDI